MGKKKFIDKRKSATFRLVYKDFALEDSHEGPERVFTRVDGGDSFVPGFSDDHPESQTSIFDDAEEEQEKDVLGSESGFRTSQAQLRAAVAPSEQARREMVELGFPDDGYNYLQHLREIGPSGRSGSFVANNHLRLDLLRPDVKAYDASRIHILCTEEGGDSDALLVSSSASRIRGPVTKAVDPDVATLLEIDDSSVFDPADELEDDFIAKANEGAESSAARVAGSEQQILISPEAGREASNGSENYAEADNDNDRPARLLDEQFELLALREYDDDEIGELDHDDLSLCGSVHVSAFNNIISDFLINNSLVQDKYETPAEIQHKNVHADDGKAKFVPNSYMGELNAPKDADFPNDSSEDEKELIITVDSDEDREQWDCETITTNYSNLENHPCKISSLLRWPDKQSLSKVVKKADMNSSLIRLRGKQQLPVEYLPEKGRHSRNDVISSSSGAMDLQEKKPYAGRRRDGESKDERKERKAALKEERRTSRRAKKELKLLYKDESLRAQHGAAFTGPVTIHLP